jgi:hypothetical protein
MASRSLGLNKQHTERLSRRGDGSGGEGRCTESPPDPITTPRQRLTTNLFVMRGGLDRDTVALDQRSKQPSTLSSPRPVLQLETGGGGDFVTVHWTIPLF